MKIFEPCRKCIHCNGSGIVRVGPDDIEIDCPGCIDRYIERLESALSEIETLSHTTPEDHTSILPASARPDLAAIAGLALEYATKRDYLPPIEKVLPSDHNPYDEIPF